MLFRLLARYKLDQRTSALLPTTRGRKRGTFTLGKKREEIISTEIRKFYLTREKRPVAALHFEIIRTSDGMYRRSACSER